MAGYSVFERSQRSQVWDLPEHRPVIGVIWFPEKYYYSLLLPALTAPLLSFSPVQHLQTYKSFSQKLGPAQLRPAISPPAIT